MTVFVYVIYQLFYFLCANPQLGEAAALQPGGLNAWLQSSNGALAPVIREVILCHKCVQQCVCVWSSEENDLFGVNCSGSESGRLSPQRDLSFPYAAHSINRTGE